MDINRDIQCHFKKYVKYITPRGIIFYDKWSYDVYMNNEDILNCKKTYPKVIDKSIHSKK
jgi:hypothetical protein